MNWNNHLQGYQSQTNAWGSQGREGPPCMLIGNATLWGHTACRCIGSQFQFSMHFLKAGSLCPAHSSLLVIHSVGPELSLVLQRWVELTRHCPTLQELLTQKWPHSEWSLEQSVRIVMSTKEKKHKVWKDCGIRGLLHWHQGRTGVRQNRSAGGSPGGRSTSDLCHATSTWAGRGRGRKSDPRSPLSVMLSKATVGNLEQTQVSINNKEMYLLPRGPIPSDPWVWACHTLQSQEGCGSDMTCELQNPAIFSTDTSSSVRACQSSWSFPQILTISWNEYHAPTGLDQPVSKLWSTSWSHSPPAGVDVEQKHRPGEEEAATCVERAELRAVLSSTYFSWTQRSHI